MILSAPKVQYDQADEQKTRSTIAQTFAKAYVKGQSIELWPNASVIMRTSTNARKRLVVHDDNTVTCEDA